MYGCRALEGMAEQEGRDGAHVSECRLVERHDNGELTRSSSRREMVSSVFRRKWFRSVALWGSFPASPLTPEACSSRDHPLSVGVFEVVSSFVAVITLFFQV